MTSEPAAIESIARHVEEQRARARDAASAGDGPRACAVYAETIDELLRNRSAYVNLRRGVGSVVGFAAGLIFDLLIPGSHAVTSLAGLVGGAFFGERIGRYAGEQLSADEYLKALVDLHHGLVECGAPEAPPLARWRALVVLETPFSIFAPILEGQAAGSSWVGVKNLLGFDPFALALESARPGLAAWPTILAMARALAPLEPLPAEAESLAMALYANAREEPAIDRLLGRTYHARLGKGIDTLAEQHRVAYSEELVALFSREYGRRPEDSVCVGNLAAILARRGALDAASGAVYLANFRLGQRNVAAAAMAARAIPVLAEHQDLLAFLTERLDQAPLPPADRLRVLEARALSLAAADDRGAQAVALYERLLAEKHVDEVALVLARTRLASGELARISGPVAATAFARRDALSGAERDALLRYFQAEAAMSPGDPRSHLPAAHLLHETGKWREAASLLEEFQLRARLPEDRLEALALLARAYRAGEQFVRAFDYYKGLCLVRPSRELSEEVVSLHEELRRKKARPSLAREVLLLVKTADPAYATAAGETIDSLLAGYASVFDQYLPDSVAKVGGGGMAEVFSAVHKESGETHIIKRLRTDFGTAEEMERFADLFGREIRAIKRINRSDHPGARHVITLHHESAEESHYCYSMEALDEVLAERLVRDGAMEAPAALPLLREIAMGLSAAHAAGVVHRDLNPRNVGFKGTVAKLFDFGTAHILRTTLHITRTPRNPDYILGTPCYMSPEQSVGDPFDERTDVFSLGCVGYELLTGEMAFPGQVGSLVLRHDPGAAARLRARLGECAPTRMADALAKAMAALPDDRYRTAAELAAALAA